MNTFARLVPLLLIAFGASAQEQELPKDLHGRWTAATASGRSAPQPFDLESVQAKDGGAFAARLTWTSADAKCTIRFQPITGRVTPTGLKFESTTPCGEAITAELARAPGGWVGKATNKATPPAVMDLTAK
jgi:hypothetical protein